MTHDPDINGSARAAGGRVLAQEAAVAITVNGTTLAVMMATPRDLADFGRGFLISEGFIAHHSAIQDIAVIDLNAPVDQAAVPGRPPRFEVQMWIDADAAQTIDARRRHAMGPVGCGLCGIDSLDQIHPEIAPPPPGFTPNDAHITAAKLAMRDQQSLHRETHGTHAAAWITPAGITRLNEDIGRHNALDKLIGGLAAAQDHGPGAVLMTSRISLDLVQKCARAGISTLIGCAPASHSAYALARHLDMNLIHAGRDAITRLTQTRPRNTTPKGPAS